MRIMRRVALITGLLPEVLGGESHPDQHVLQQAPAVVTTAHHQLCPLEQYGPWRTTPGTCPVEAPQRPSVNETAPSSSPQTGDDDGDGWVRGALCHEIPGGSPDVDGPFCTFTHPSFNHGLGLSVITTPAVFEKLSALPVFLSTTTTPSTTTETPAATPPRPPYRAEPIPGKGLGLVAARRLPAGDIFLARTPAVMVDDGAVQRLGRARLAALLAAAVGALPAPHGAEYLRLTTHDAVEGYEDKVYQIFMKNNFQTPVEGVGGFQSAFTEVSRLNHACRPNSEYFFDDRTLSHKVFTARDIEPGEELTVTYSDPFQPRHARQTHLLHHWGFHCTCALCTAPAATIAQSDARIDAIRALWAVLDDYSSTNSNAPPSSPSSSSEDQDQDQDQDLRATPEAADRLLALYRDEGLVTRMVEAYYRAAVERNGAGDAAGARAMAERSVAAGQVMEESAIRPFLANMRALAADPEGHWTWRFRVRPSA